MPNPPEPGADLEEPEEADAALRLLGRIDLQHRDGTPIQSVLAQPRRVALLAYLAAARPVGVHSRDKLLALLWPESDERRARDLLNTNLSSLRRSLGKDAVISRGTDGVALNRRRVWTDVQAFRLALAGDRAADALDLYRGPLLDGFHLGGTSGFEEWLEGERRHLRRAAGQAALRLAEREAEAGEARLARKHAETALDIWPDDEVALRLLMSILDEAGDRAGALRRHSVFAASLKQRFGTQPSPETQRLLERIRERAEVRPGAAVSGGPRGVVGDPPGPAAGARADGSIGAPPAAAEKGPASGTAARGGRLRPNRRAAVAVVGAAVVAAAVVAALLVVLTNPDASGGSDVPLDSESVVVFPFEVRGPDIEYLREGMVDLLAGKLDRVGPIHAVSPRVVLRETTRDPGDLTVDGARSAAGRLGARTLILGSVTAIDGALRIEAELFGATSDRAVARANAQGAEKDLFRLVDELARELLAEHLDAAGQHLAGVGASTTRSVEALRPYLEGEARFRSGSHRGAIESFRQALEADSMFALARYRLSGAAAWAGESELARNQAEHALQLADRVPESQARLIRAWHAYLTGQGDEAERIYRSIVTANPTDVEAWYRLGEVLFHYGPTRGRRVEQSAEAFRAVVRLEPDHVIALAHLGRLAAVQADAPHLRLLIDRLDRLESAPSQRLELEVLYAVLVRDSVGLAALADELGQTDAHLRETVVRSVAAFNRDLDAAARLADRLTRDSDGQDRRENALLLRAHLAVGRGRWTEAERRLDDLMEIAPDLARSTRLILVTRPFVALDSTALAAPASPAADPLRARSGSTGEEPVELDYALGLLLVERGRSRDASVAADRLRQSHGPYSRRLADLLLAAVLAERGDAHGALERLGPPSLLVRNILPDIRQHPKAAERYLRGLLLQRVGRPREALAWFESIPDPSGYDVAYLAPSHLHRAQIHETLGDVDSARLHYERVLELWRDPDPPLRPTWREAVEGLRRLGRSGAAG